MCTNSSSKKQKQDNPYTPAQIKKAFKDYGVSYTQFASDNEVDRQTLVNLLHGDGKGTRGMSHKAAVLLGLKRDPVTKTFKHPFGEEAKAA